MRPLPLTRSVGRFLAVWLLLWFLAMGASPASSSGDRSGCAPVPDADPHAQIDPQQAAHTHTHTHAHEGRPLEATRCDEGSRAGGFEGDHTAHASGSSLLHCPLCMHAAAPAPTFQPDASAGVAPARFSRWPEHVHFCAQTTPLPPARGPPAFS